MSTDFDNYYMRGVDYDYPAISNLSTPPYIVRETDIETLLGFPVVVSEKVPRDEIRFLDPLAEKYTIIKIKE